MFGWTNTRFLAKIEYSNSQSHPTPNFWLLKSLVLVLQAGVRQQRSIPGGAAERGIDGLWALGKWFSYWLGLGSSFYSETHEYIYIYMIYTGGVHKWGTPLVLDCFFRNGKSERTGWYMILESGWNMGFFLGPSWFIWIWWRITPAIPALSRWSHRIPPSPPTGLLGFPKMRLPQQLDGL